MDKLQYQRIDSDRVVDGELVDDDDELVLNGEEPKSVIMEDGWVHPITGTIRRNTINPGPKTLRRQERFLEIFEKNAGNVKRSCQAARISRSGFHKWCTESPNTDDCFDLKIHACRQGFIDDAESLLKKQMGLGDTTAIIFYLKTKGRDRGYIESRYIRSDNTVSNSVTLQLDDKSEKFLEDLLGDD